MRLNFVTEGTLDFGVRSEKMRHPCECRRRGFVAKAALDSVTDLQYKVETEAYPAARNVKS